MPHVIEPAASGRAKCRGCGALIPKGEMRLGERLPNPFGDGEMTLWFHLACAAYKRPEPLLAALEAAGELPDNAEWLEREARRGIAHRRLPRIHGAERSPTGRARCRSCRELIGKGTWRIPLLYYEEGRFEPSGSIHLHCSRSYFDTNDVLDRLVHFTPGLSAGDLEEIRADLAGAESPGHGPE